MLTRRFVVTGRVQGVGYRFFTANEAHRLGLVGFARNLADGSVEVIVRGASQGLRLLRAVLREGPALSRVEKVVEEDFVSEEQWDGFDIR